MKQPTCFLVDDDQDDREIFMIALENADNAYQCVTAKNGVDAVNMIKSDPAFDPDFIFIDLNMPYMSGKECLEFIKNSDRFFTTPVVMYTTSSYSRDIEETKELGASHFLVKPPGINSLTKILFDILNKKDLPYLIEIEN
jgi:CheY-like chemotaxis protein